ERPDRFVVVELGVPLHLGERRGSGVLVPRRVEVEPVTATELAVAVRAEVGTGTGESEVDVEDDRAQHGPTIGALPHGGGEPRARDEARAPGAVVESNRGAQIRTGDLSDPNGARYQAAPHPEPGN